METAVADAGGALNVALGLVLAWAAVAKARDQESVETMLASLGVPHRLLGAGTFAAIAVEGMIAVWLLSLRSSLAAAVAAVVLFAVLAAISGVAIARGVRTTCACFGRSSRTLGWGTLRLAGGCLAAAVLAVGAATAGQPVPAAAYSLGVGLGGWAVALGLWAVVRRVRRMRRAIAVDISRLEELASAGR